ncbi:uncharacterized protein LOC121985052 isoform X1 [Zingiber officinale]|uniref:uncharacterized protein LOC121985052 isoform X1 n=1 Tax=Zingiber officinale TaxID=94328 RepID=UPI001C4D1D65|nr:uncharacterized protein LOC121985052 isoform X1 [Zingiber officinale]
MTPDPRAACNCKIPYGSDVDEEAATENEGGATMALCSCFGPSKAERRAADLAESQDARAKAAEAAQRRSNMEVNRRQEQFDKSAAGRAAKAQMAAAAKQSSESSKGEPVLKWQMG